MVVELSFKCHQRWPKQVFVSRTLQRDWFLKLTSDMDCSSSSNIENWKIHLNFMRQFLKGMFEEMLGHEIPFVCLMINGQESFRAHIHEVQVQHRVWFSMEKPPFIFYLRHSGDIKKGERTTLSSLLFNLSLPAWDFDSKNCLALQNMLKTASKRKGRRQMPCL